MPALFIFPQCLLYPRQLGLSFSTTSTKYNVLLRLCSTELYKILKDPQESRIDAATCCNGYQS